MTRRLTKWIPAGAAVVVVAGVAVATGVAGSASASLPPRTAHEVVQLALSEKVHAFSGTVTETSDLGLPSLSSSAAGSSAGSSGSSGSSDSDLSSLLTLITGTNTGRVYVDGPSKERVQLFGQLSEKDVVRNGDDVWTWDSGKQSAQHATLPSRSSARTDAGATSMSPSELATRIITALSPTSTLTVGDPLQVAGRTAYQLILAPKATDTLVQQVTISVDSQTGLPLGVDIAARGQSTPALHVQYTDLSLATPAASRFEFTPPKGASVKTVTPKQHHEGAPSGKAKTEKPTVTGTGWDAVVTVPASDTASALAGLQKSPQFAELTTAVSGGRLFSTSLVNVLFTDDGRILAGSVSASRLAAVASGS